MQLYRFTALTPGTRKLTGGPFAGRLPAYLAGILGVFALALAAALLWLLPIDPVQAQDEAVPAQITAGPTIISSPESGDTYRNGETITIAFTYDQPVVVAGKPRLRLSIGERKRWARYDRSDQDGARLLFAYVVKAKDLDADGISIGKNEIDLKDRGTIQDGDGNRARVRHQALPAQADHRVDGIAPTVTAVSIISAPREDDTYGSGDHIQAAVTFSEPVRIDGEPRLRLSIGGKKRWAKYAYSAENGARLVFAYVVKFKDQDDDGISIGKNALDLNDGSMRDAAGNAANPAHGKLPPDPAQKVDGGGGERQGTVTAPAKPMDLWATGGNESVTLIWCAPDSEWDNPTITKYQVKVGSGSWTDMEGSNGDPLLEEHTVTGLSNGTEYAIRIRAVNAAGEGVQSDEVKATPKASVPAKPAGLTLTPSSINNGVWLDWNDPADASKPVYQVWASGGGHAGEWEDYYPEEIEKLANGKLRTYGYGPVLGEDYEVCDAEGCADMPPVPGVQYTYRVRAVNGNGPGLAETVTGSPVAGWRSPATPDLTTATVGNGQVTLNWTNPNNSKIYGYLFRVASGAGADYGPIAYVPGSDSATTSHTFAGLTNGTQYRFVIAAFTLWESSAFTAAVTVTPSE